jgi:hypothetical protein
MRWLHKIILLMISVVGAMALTRAGLADKLKEMSGRTLKNPLVFVQYGNGPFDWLLLPVDGSYIAKLEGMNPDGTFRYTIITDPKKYGLHFNVSLNGVTIDDNTLSDVPTLDDLLNKKIYFNQNRSFIEIKPFGNGMVCNLSDGKENSDGYFQDCYYENGSIVIWKDQPYQYTMTFEGPLAIGTTLKIKEAHEDKTDKISKVEDFEN